MENQMQCFHQKARNQETNSRVLFSKTLTRQIWEDLFLKAIKIICSVKQDISELMKQEHQVGSLNDCISELQKQAYAQRLELQYAQHRYFESPREQVHLQKLSMKEKVLRETQIQNMHEMGEIEESSRTTS